MNLLRKGVIDQAYVPINCTFKWIFALIIALDAIRSLTKMRQVFGEPVKTTKEFCQLCGAIGLVIRHLLFYIAVLTKKEDFQKAVSLSGKFWRQLAKTNTGIIVSKELAHILLIVF